MRQTIGATWIFQLVLIFTLIFAAYIALTINYSKAYKVKNEVISIVEKNQGFTEDGVKIINNYLTQIGYHTVGYCTGKADAVVFGVKDIDPNYSAASVEVASPSQKYYYCFSKYGGYHIYYKSRAYYRVTLFFKFDLPVLGDITTFDVDGQTSEIDATFDSDELSRWNK